MPLAHLSVHLVDAVDLLDRPHGALDVRRGVRHGRSRAFRHESRFVDRRRLLGLNRSIEPGFSSPMAAVKDIADDQQNDGRGNQKKGFPIDH